VRAVDLGVGMRGEHQAGELERDPRRLDLRVLARPGGVRLALGGVVGALDDDADRLPAVVARARHRDVPEHLRGAEPGHVVDGEVGDRLATADAADERHLHVLRAESACLTCERRVAVEVVAELEARRAVGSDRPDDREAAWETDRDRDQERSRPLHVEARDIARRGRGSRHRVRGAV
jgi:hypothetical protein